MKAALGPEGEAAARASSPPVPPLETRPLSAPPAPEQAEPSLVAGLEAMLAQKENRAVPSASTLPPPSGKEPAVIMEEKPAVPPEIEAVRRVFEGTIVT
jgi:hypothetical protein